MCFCLNFNLRYSKSQTTPKGDVFYIHGNQNVQTIINPNIGNPTSKHQEYHSRSNFPTNRPISDGLSSSGYEPVEPYDNNTKLLHLNTHGASHKNNLIASGPPCKGQGANPNTSSPFSSGSMIGYDKSKKALHQYANITQGRNGESEGLPLQDQKVCSHGNSLSGEYVPMTVGYDNNRKLSHSYANITGGGTSNNPDVKNEAAPDVAISQKARHKLQEDVSNESAEVEAKVKHQISFKMYDYPDTSE